MTQKFSDHLDTFPHVAILRGLEDTQVPPVADALYENGWRSLEVPLNRPGALEALNALAERLEGTGVIVGAGTITSVDDFSAARAAGAKFFLSPHTDETLLAHSSAHNLDYVPGCATPSDAMIAIRHGCSVIKLFPYTLLGPEFISAMRGVAPTSIRFMAVGGVSLDTIRNIIPPADYAGVGSALFQQGMKTEDLATRARQWRKVVAA